MIVNYLVPVSTSSIVFLSNEPVRTIYVASTVISCSKNLVMYIYPEYLSFFCLEYGCLYYYLADTVSSTRLVKPLKTIIIEPEQAAQS